MSISDNATSRNDCVEFITNNEDEALSTGVYKITVKLLKEAADILIRPKFVKLTNADIKIDGTNGEFIPTKGTYNLIVGRKMELSFSPDSDYEFIRWQVYDENTDEEIQNGLYLAFDEPKEKNTFVTFKGIPENREISIAVRPIVAERPHVLAYTPSSDHGVLKDSSIQVLFDRDMDPSSIYYIQDEEKDEVAELIASGIAESELLKDSTSGKVYGYKKDGVTHFKNISIINKKTGADITGCFAAPMFENKSSLSISVREKTALDDYTNVLVTIEKGFFYTEQGKHVEMYGSKKWLYQVNDKTDEKSPVIMKENNKELFETKVTSRTSLVALSKQSSKPAITDGSEIENFSFMSDGKLYLNLRVQDPDGGSGPKNNFKINLKRVYDENYAEISTPADSDKYSTTIDYLTVAADEALFKGTIDLKEDLDFSLSDGVYEMSFVFSDRSGNDATYPESGCFYFTKDTHAPSNSNIKIEGTDTDSSYKVTWTGSGSLDYNETVVSVVGSSSQDITVSRGTSTATITGINKGEVNSVIVICRDYFGNETTYTMPKFLTGVSVSGNSSFKIDNVFFTEDVANDYNLTATAVFSDGSSKDISNELVISNAPQITAGEITTEAYMDGEISKRTVIEGSYYVAAKKAKLTEKVKFMELLAGTTSKYCYFGDFPQRISSLPENSYSAEPVYKNWYLGSDGFFYEKCQEKAGMATFKYSDGTAVGVESANSFKYFKVEPIMWYIINKNDPGEKKFLLSNYILTSNLKFTSYTGSAKTNNSPAPYKNNYKYSNIRAYLNGTESLWVKDGGKNSVNSPDWTDKGFLQTAFTKNAQERILTTLVDNSADSTASDRSSSIPKADGSYSENPENYICEDTQDKIFLLSVNEVSTLFIFEKKEPTDYAKANGVFYEWRSDVESGYKKGIWWLRSPSAKKLSGTKKETVSYIKASGAIDCCEAFDKDCGIVPAMYVDKIEQ
ncbi:MAG: hypothetical protein IKO57_11190 [Treponema sp.]|nr:hypothetical protein [Treponema sp.]